MSTTRRYREKKESAKLLQRAGTFFVGNYSDKLFALLAAIVIYIYVSQETAVPSGIMKVPLDVLSPDGTLATVLQPEDRYVFLELEGPAREIDRVRAAARQVVRVRLESREEREQLVALKPTDFRLDPGDTPVSSGITVRYRSGFATVLVKVQEAETGWLPVKVVHDGDLQEGTRIAQERAVPDQVRVRAPKEFFRNPGHVPTLKVPLGRSGPGEKTITVELDTNPGGRSIRILGSERVTARVLIEAIPIERSVPGVPVFLLSRPDLPYKFSLPVENTCEVRLEGPKAAVEQLDPARLFATVNPQRDWGADPVAQEIEPFHVDGVPVGVRVSAVSKVSVKAEPR